MTDMLTNLPCRQQFVEYLQCEVRKSNEYQAPIALLVIDIRRFTSINKTHGYSSGDKVLNALADVLRQVRRKDDYLARIGDDQFVLVLSQVINPGHALLAAIKIQRLLEVPVPIKSGSIRCKSVIGIALCPLHASEPEALLRKAEEELEYAKRMDQNIGMPEQLVDEAISDDWDIELELTGAIDRSELRVYFQPKISLLTGKPTGAEALVRWESPTRGLMPPDSFISIANEIGFIKPLTVWMLNSSLRLSGEWSDKWGPLSVSVNMPTQMIAQPDFLDLVMSAKNLWKNDDITLCIEVLEQSFISDVKHTFKMLKEMRGQGVKVSIDDFGTGYSSLSYFRDIPADELKIDRSFVMGLLTDKSNANIVSLIIDMAHRFDLSVVAEGVEDKATLDELAKLKCDVVQGYYFAKPMPAREFRGWLLNYTIEHEPYLQG